MYPSNVYFFVRFFLFITLFFFMTARISYRAPSGVPKLGQTSHGKVNVAKIQKLYMSCVNR